MRMLGDDFSSVYADSSLRYSPYFYRFLPLMIHLVPTCTGKMRHRVPILTLVREGYSPLS